MNKQLIRSLLLLFVQIFAAQTFFAQTIKGTIIDSDSKRPLMHALVHLSGTQYHTQTDSLGYFYLSAPNGSYQVQIQYIGYKSQQANIVLMSGKQMELNIELLASQLNIDAAIVNSDFKQSTSSMLTLRSSDYANIVGSINDPVRLLINLPGVLGVSDFVNDLSVRGNSSMGVLWSIEGMEVMNPNHYTNSGSSGGVLSVLNATTIGTSRFYTGAFPSKFGNVLSGVYDVQLRDGNMDRMEGAVEINNLDGSITLETPLIHKKASILLAYRQSLVDVFDLINKSYREQLGATPEFKDFTFKLALKGKTGSKTNLWGVMGQSDISVPPSVSSFYQIENNSKSMNVGINHQLFWGPRIRLRLQAGISSLETLNSYSSVTNQSSYRSMSDKEWSSLTGFEADFKVTAKNKIQVGAQIRMLESNLRHKLSQYDEDTLYNFAIHKRYNATNAFAQWQHQFNNRLSVTAGVHYYQLSLNKHYRIEPRWSVNYIRNHHSFGLAFGEYSKQNPMSVYLGQVVRYDAEASRYYRSYPNIDLDFIKSRQVVLSYQTVFKKLVNYKTEFYYQHHYAVPMAQEYPYLSVLNLSYYFTDVSRNDVVWENKGTARSFGWEQMLSIDNFRGYTANLSSSLFRSTIQSASGTRFSTYYDTRYTFKLVVGKEIKLKSTDRYLRFDLSLNWQGGRRYTPLDYFETYRQRTIVWDESKYLEGRYADYFRIDCKLGYHMNVKNTTHVLSVDVRNLSNHQNIFDQYYDWNDGAIQTSTAYQLRLFPVVSYKLYFGAKKRNNEH